jgi:hypothetical protein
MLRVRRRKSAGRLAAGFVAGLALGGALALGVLLGQRSQPAVPALGPLQLKATATHGSDTFAIATGAIDEDVEGLFTLDYLTGDLQCFVINPRNGAVGGWFKTNVAAAFSGERGKKPAYLLTTGHITPTGGYGAGKPAGCLCYVADANTGEVAAFTFPWVKAATTAGQPQMRPMSLVKMWKARDVDLRQ